MSTLQTKWIDAALLLIAEFLSKNDFDRLNEVVHEARGKGRVTVAVIGPYDGGKSTVIKRLLVEAGVCVPEWLGVSGRRETFVARRADCEKYELLDTPGFFSGNEQHDREALEAMKMVDAFLIVLPPQLLTSGTELAGEMLSGKYFSPAMPRGYMANSCVITVSRMDEAGIDPADNILGFRELCQKKKSELLELLKKIGVKPNPEAMLCIAADPYQLVGDAPSPSRSDYGGDPSWDGISELRQLIDIKVADRERLREAALVRFVCATINDLGTEISTRSTGLTSAMAAAENEVDRMSIYLKRAEALCSSALANLRRMLEEQVLGVERSGKGVTESLAKLDRRLMAVVDRWEKESNPELDALIDNAEAELADRVRTEKVRPSFDGCTGHDATEQADFLKAGKHIKRLAPTMKAGFKTYASSTLGMSLTEANKRLKAWENSGKPLKEFIAERGKKAGFKSVQHAEKAASIAKLGRILDAAAPLVEQLLGIGLDVYEDIKAAKQAEKEISRLNDLRSQLRAHVDEIVNWGSEPFLLRCSALTDWLQERQRDEQTRIEIFRREAEQIEAISSGLNDHLAKIPLPFG